MAALECSVMENRTDAEGDVKLQELKLIAAHY